MMRGDLRSVGVGFGLLVVGCAEEVVRNDDLGERRRLDCVEAEPARLECAGEACAPVTIASACPAEGWCWVRGWPTDVHGTSGEGSVVAIGPSGVFLRWDGERWQSQPVPTSLAIVSAAAEPEGDAWAVDASGLAWQWHEGRWREVPKATGPLLRIVRVVGSTAYATTDRSEAEGAAVAGELVRSDGGEWTSVASDPTCRTGQFWVLDSGEVWSACRKEIRRHDGSGWVSVGEPVENEAVDDFIRSIFEYGGRVRVATILDTFEWSGSEWIAVELEDPRSGSSEQRHVPAAQGQPDVVVPRALACNEAFRLDDAHAWCFGGAQIYVADGETWTPTLHAGFEATQDADDWGTIPPTLWAGADTSRAWGSDPSNVFRIRKSAAKAERYDGDGWCVLEDGEATDVHGFAADDVWVATAAGLVHFDGDAFTLVPSPGDAEDPAVTLVHALGPGVVLAVVDGGSLYRYDGRWSLLFSATDPEPAVTGTLPWSIVSIASTSPSDVWLVRSGGIRKAPGFEVFRYDGSTWSLIDAKDHTYVESLAKWLPSGGVSGFGKVFTRNDEVWLATGGSISQLPDQDVVIEGAWSGSFWFGPDDTLWATTSSQARRYALP